MIRPRYKGGSQGGGLPEQLSQDAGTLVLLHFNGTSGSSAVYDEVSMTNLVSRAVTLLGDGSAQFGGDSTPIDLGSRVGYLNNFTAEFIVTIQTPQGASQEVLLGSNYPSVNSRCQYATGGDLSIYTSNTYYSPYTSAVQAGKHHLAFTRNGTNAFFHIDGVKSGNTISIPNTALNFTGGCIGGLRGVDTYQFTGIMHECRISNFARYTTPTITIG